ncbi:MAG: hypothetical protein C5B43_03765 [Verrucomicrobia bacterium]|nr:MAG: hypothetical protein C5B43_03765 [Verrucomicrobiota bacterium]
MPEDIRASKGNTTQRVSKLYRDEEKEEIQAMAKELFAGRKINWYKLGFKNYIKSWIYDSYADKVRSEFLESIKSELNEILQSGTKKQQDKFLGVIKDINGSDMTNLNKILLSKDILDKKISGPKKQSNVQLSDADEIKETGRKELGTEQTLEEKFKSASEVGMGLFYAKNTLDDLEKFYNIAYAIVNDLKLPYFKSFKDRKRGFEEANFPTENQIKIIQGDIQSMSTQSLDALRSEYNVAYAKIQNNPKLKAIIDKYNPYANTRENNIKSPMQKVALAKATIDWINKALKNDEIENPLVEEEKTK